MRELSDLDLECVAGGKAARRRGNNGPAAVSAPPVDYPSAVRAGGLLAGFGLAASAGVAGASPSGGSSGGDCPGGVCKR